MKCPKCNSENIQTSIIKTKKSTIWIGILLLTIGLTLMLSIIGLGIAIVADIIILLVAPKHETVGVCQSCGFTFDPKTNKEKKL